jgi:hypothetical protein
LLTRSIPRLYCCDCYKTNWQEIINMNVLVD